MRTSRSQRLYNGEDEVGWWGAASLVDHFLPSRCSFFVLETNLA